MSSALEKLTFSILLLDNLSKPAKGICRSLRRIQKISSAGFSNIKLGVANMAGGAAALSGFVSPVLFEPDQSAGRSRKKRGNKAKNDNPKINYRGEFTYFSTGFPTKNSQKNVQHGVIKAIKRNEANKHHHYAIQVFSGGRRENTIVYIFPKFKDAAHHFLPPFIIDTITQKGEMSNVYIS
ncbi:MAG: hypothetical protein MR727_04080 [Lentisphaeria bacterium]|nr:hypothetical protein [Lentisphaeria bacterium]